MPYPKMDNEDYVGIVIPSFLKEYWHLIRKPDRKGIISGLKMFDQPIDLCHYDSDKSYYGRSYAYPLLWNSLKEGGIFISDDIQDNFAFKDFVVGPDNISSVRQSQIEGNVEGEADTFYNVVTGFNILNNQTTPGLNTQYDQISGTVELGKFNFNAIANLASVSADIATNAWGPDGARGKALFVPCNLADPDAGVVALDPDDYVVLPVLVGTVG